jgi:hypothetical protein
MTPPINWKYPPPRPGWRKEIDTFIGPGVTRAELILELVVSLAGGLLMLAYALTQPLGWTGWQIALAVLLAFDLAGGVVTNATSTAKRWYHRPGQGFRQHFTFIAVHGIHLALVAWAFRAGDWDWAIGWYTFLMLASLLILWLPLYLRRPVAFSVFGLGLLFALYLDTPVPGLEWFIPVFLLKLIVSHLLREEPYRPENEGAQEVSL